MMKTYRRARKTDAWHLCANCPNWPTVDYDTRTERPNSAELCSECKRYQAGDNCS